VGLVVVQGGHAAGLEGAPDLVEQVAVIAHELAGLGDVAKLFGEFSRENLRLMLWVEADIWVLLDGLDGVVTTNLPKTQVSAPLGATRGGLSDKCSTQTPGLHGHLSA
jgi:hypothetical protein